MYNMYHCVLAGKGGDEKALGIHQRTGRELQAANGNRAGHPLKG